MNILIIIAKIKFLKSAIIPKKKSIVFKYKKEKLIIVFKYKKKKIIIFFSFLSECSFAATSTSNNEFNRITDLLNTEQKEYNIIYN